MNPKSICFVLPALFILVLFISGCTQLIDKKPPQLPESKENAFTEADQKIISGLISKLNFNVVSYKASYKKEHEYHSWRGHSGARSYTEESGIFIEVINKEIINYTIRYTKKGFFPEEKDYYKYFKKDTGELCLFDVVNSARCAYSEEPVAPKMGGFVEGCRVKSYGGRHCCICGGREKSIAISENIEPKMPCKEPIQTDGFELWDEFNIIYYPKNNESLCYFVTKPEENRFAFECMNKNIKLIPDIRTNEELKNPVCRYSKYNYLCSCTFDPIRIDAGCKKEIPENFDFNVKRDILNYLKNLEIASISEEDNKNGHCYSFSYDGLKHSFCFNEDGLITFAQWGRDIRKERSTSVDINKINKTEDNNL